MAFNELEEKFLYCAKAIPPKFDEMKRLLAEGVDINAYDSCLGETLLSDAILGYPSMEYPDCDGCSAINECEDKCLLTNDEEHSAGSAFLPSVVQFFLENGYDVTLRNGEYGGVALKSLSWSTYDQYIIDAARLLLDAGADPNWQEDGESVLEWIGVKCGAALTVDEDSYVECVFEVLYDMLEAKVEGRPYQDIMWYDAVYGKRIDRVYSCAETPEKAVYELTTGDSVYKNVFETNLVFDCEGLQLQLNQWCNAKVDSNVPNREKRIDLSHMFAPVIGKRIIEMREAFVEKLNGIICEIHSSLSGGKENLKIVYLKNCEKGVDIRARMV